MSPLLKSLLGNGSRDRELTDEMRAIVTEMQEKHDRYEALLRKVQSSAEKLQQLGEPYVKIGAEVDAMVSRFTELEQRASSIALLSDQFQKLDEQAANLIEGHRQSGSEISSTLEEATRLRALFEEVSGKIDAALELKDKLAAFVDVDKPFQELMDQATSLRGHVDGTGEQLARLREQHDRMLDAHKLAVTKMEALDRRRDDLGRELTDKERRVASVEQAVRGMDGVQTTVDQVRREIGTLKALADSVVQKSAALEAQRQAVEQALAQADGLERAMRQLDAGVRHQQDNEKSLAKLQDTVTNLKSLHEEVIERSSEITKLQRDTDERTQASRQDLSAATDEMRKTIERFDFESRGLESVSQRVADLRATLLDCENRFKPLNASSLAVSELGSQSKNLGAQLRALSTEVGQVDQEMEKFRTIRESLGETGRSVREIETQLAHVAETRPSLEAALRDLEHLRGTHAMVKDALEQAQLAQAEIGRMRDNQAHTREWLLGVERGMSEMRDQVAELQKLAPGIEVVQKQSQRLSESIAEIEARRESVEDLHRRMLALGSLGGKLEERGKQLQTGMETAEQKLAELVSRTEEIDRLNVAVAKVTSEVTEAERKTVGVAKAVDSISERCESVEALAEKTRALKPELDQRHQAVVEAGKELHRAHALRKDAATSAQQLDDLSKKLFAAVETAEKRLSKNEELAGQLDSRTTYLKAVEKRVLDFEGKLSQWEPIEKEILTSLDQISSRQGIVETLRADLDRMFATTEKTAGEVREITSAQQEIEQSRRLLAEVMEKLVEVRDTASGLDERKRQMSKAEERLARAEAVLQDVRSSLEALQGQKEIVDQAVEKAGSLQFLVKQAEAVMDGLRGERDMTARVRAAVSVVRNEQDEDYEDEAEDQARTKKAA